MVICWLLGCCYKVVRLFLVIARPVVFRVVSKVLLRCSGGSYVVVSCYVFFVVARLLLHGC